MRAGVPLERTWQYATARAAATLPVPALGRLEPGAPADLAIFREDPTANVEALKTLEAVAIQGPLERIQTLRRPDAIPIRFG